jgi:DNA replicative helicase MCM subunit Mcm2 (Cdc46/Mcm family)
MATSGYSFSHDTSPLFGISRYCPSLKVRLQEVEEKERGGRVPRTVDIELFEDLCDSCVPGDVVTVTGVVKVGEMQSYGNPDPAFQVNPDPIRIQDFDDQKLKEKKMQQKCFKYLFMIKNYYLPYF